MKSHHNYDQNISKYAPPNLLEIVDKLFLYAYYVLFAGMQQSLDEHHEICQCFNLFVNMIIININVTLVCIPFVFNSLVVQYYACQDYVFHGTHVSITRWTIYNCKMRFEHTKCSLHILSYRFFDILQITFFFVALGWSLLMWPNQNKCHLQDSTPYCVWFH